MREDNKQDCADVLGHTVGCVKSKYVDLEERQIGQCPVWLPTQKDYLFKNSLTLSLG